MSRTSKRKTAAALALLLALAAGWATARSEPSDDESALDAHLRQHPGALDDGSLGLLETRVLDALTPAQAQAWAAGEDPRSIFLESGETLASFIASLLAGGQGLVYVPLDSCLVLRTVDSVAGVMAADETRGFLVRGATTDLSDQGGSAGGCGVPTEAVAVAMHFRVRSMTPGVIGRLFANRTGGPGLPNRAMEYVRQGPEGHAGISLVGLCEGVCATDFDLRTLGVSAQVRGDVMGFFRPMEPGDVAGLPLDDADTLDGLDSTDFALAIHTHDGGDITSGTVGEPFIDPSITRDSEVVDILKAGDGSGSGFDADLLDGKELTAFRPRPANVILVHPTDGDFATIQGALDAIGVAPDYPAASAANRYLIRVGVGVYNEQVTMDPFVDIEGKGKKATVISSPSVAGPMGTVECADHAELRNLTVESTGGDEKAIAIRCLGTSPMLTHVRAVATGAAGSVPENIGVLNDGAATTPMLTGMHVDANPSPGIGVVNQNGAVPTIRDSDVDGADSAIENRDTAEANVVYTRLAGGADFMAPATQSSFHCVRAFVAGTLLQLNAECSPNTPPTATDDMYATLGNTQLDVDLAAPSGFAAVVGPDGGPVYADVLDNDNDAETPAGLTAAVVPATVTAGAVVTMNADGSFSYTPPVGFTGGTDSFDYTVTDPGGLMDTGTVEITVSQMIWFVDADNVGTADGRSATPFASLLPLDGANGAGDPDASGHTIFVFDETTGNTQGPIELEDSQILHGNGMALDPAGFDYAGGGALVPLSATVPTVDALASDVIELANGNTIRGLDVSVGAASAGITGTGAAGLTIDDVSVTAADPTALGIRLGNSSGSFDFDDLTISGGASGIELNGGTATFDFDSIGSISGADPAILINGGSTGMTFNGDVTHTSGSNPAIAIEGGHTGTVTFQTGTINVTAGTGLGFDNADGTYNFNGTTTLNGGDAGIDILSGSSGTFTFGAGTSITNPTNEGVNIDTSTGGNVDYNGTISQSNADPAVKINAKTGGSVTFAGNITANTATANGIDLTSNGGSTITFSGVLDLDTTTGTGFNATGGGTVQATNAANSVNTVGDGIGSGIGVNIGAGIGASGVTFNSVDVGSSGKANSGILLTNTGNAGTFSVTGGTIQNTTNRGFSAANVDGTVNIGADIQNDGGRSVEIATGSAGTLTFSGAIDDDAQGINISSNGTGGTFTFQGGLDIDTIAGNHGLRAFSGGTINVCDDSNCSAAGGTAKTNTVDTSAGTGTGVIIDGVTIGAEGVTFRSVSANGSTNGIVLDTTGAGSFEVTGDGSTATQGGNDTGGVIANTTGDGVLLEATQGVTLRNMTIGDVTATPADSPDATNNIASDGIEAKGVTGLNLFNVTIARTAGHGVNGVSVAAAASITNLTVDDSLILNAGDGQEEHGLNLDELRGDNFVRDSLFDAFNETGIEVMNSSGTVDLSIDDTTFQDNQLAVGNAGEEAILLIAFGTAQIVALVTGDPNTSLTKSIFDDIERQSIQAISEGTSSDIQLTVENSRFLEHDVGDAIIIMNPDNSGTGNVTIKNNFFTDDTFGAFAVLLKNDSTGTLDGTVQSNTVTNLQLMNVRHDSLGSGGAANGTSRVLVGGSTMALGNTVTVGTNNIAVDVFLEEIPATGSAPDVSFTAMNNTTTQPDNNFTFTPGLRVDVQDATRANLNISSNSFQGDPSTSGGSGIEVREQDTSVVGLQGFGGGNAAAAASFIDTANPGSADASFVTSHDGNIGSGTATLPTATTLPSP